MAHFRHPILQGGIYATICLKVTNEYSIGIAHELESSHILLIKTVKNQHASQ